MKNNRTKTVTILVMVMYGQIKIRLTMLAGDVKRVDICVFLFFSYAFWDC